MARYYRRVIHIPATCSPNVQLGQRQQEAGVSPTDEVIVPGVLTWGEYQKRLRTWDPMRQCIGLEARFWRGKEVSLYPYAWLQWAADLARQRSRSSWSNPRWIGCDPAEGGDKSTWSVIDRMGLLQLVSLKTPDTTVVVSTTLALMREHNVPGENVGLDRGGGGKEHADRLRAMGYPVRTVAFGESLILDLKRGMRRLEEKKEFRETKYAYVNRRAQMAHELSVLIDPDNPDYHSLPQETGRRSSSSLSPGFAIPDDSAGEQYGELRRQMAVIPKLLDPEGRYRMLPKRKKSEGSKEKSLEEIIGHSPDEYDSLCVAAHMMLHKQRVAVAGGI